MAYDTAATIISKAAREMGLVSADIADPFASTDANVLQLCALLEALGQDLVGEHPWSQLRRTHTFSTVASTEAYDFPADFDRLVDGTEWNRTQQWPLSPVSAQQWQQLKARSSAGTVYQLFRVMQGANGGQIYVYPTPAATETIAFEYLSGWWTEEDGGGQPTANTVEGAAWKLWFPRRLLVTGLKSRFLRAKGFNSSAADAEFADALDRAKGSDGAAPALSLAGGSSFFRLVDGRNAPDSGYGS